MFVTFTKIGGGKISLRGHKAAHVEEVYGEGTFIGMDNGNVLNVAESAEFVLQMLVSRGDPNE